MSADLKKRPAAGVADRMSLWLPLAAFAALILLVQPWGNYPVNDDWLFARITKRFVDTGKFLIDSDVAPSVLGQTLIALPVIKVFGFSFLHLRILTMAMGAFLLYLVWRLLGFAALKPAIKGLALLILVLNPLFAHLSLSFMTEIYGHTVALAGAVLWFWGRQRAEAVGQVPDLPKALRKADRRSKPASTRAAAAQDDIPVVSWPVALGTALVVGASFWIRQYCVTIYPAILSATILRCAMSRQWRRLRSSAPRMIASCGMFAAVVAAYFPWANSGVASPGGEFSARIGRVAGSAQEWGQALQCEPGMFLIYMTAFLLPLLVLSRWRGRRPVPALAVSAALVAVGLLAISTLPSIIEQNHNSNLHRNFPFASNVIYNAGIGPVTLPDVVIGKLPLSPKWPETAWILIEWILLAASALWTPAILDLAGTLGRKENSHLAELFWFGWIFSLASFAGVLITAKFAFDRYYLPSIVGLVMVQAISLGWGGYPASPQTDVPQDHRPRFAARPALWVAALAFGVLGYFTVAGVHDYFRWNDARSELYANLLRQGVPPLTIDAGYELNGWYGQGGVLSPSQCIGGRCTCASNFYCLDDSFRIGMNVFGNYEVVDSRQPDYWLAKGPAVVLSRRKTH
jgi:hypothetical protein